jgi:hypothetical protein
MVPRDVYELDSGEYVKGCPVNKNDVAVNDVYLRPVSSYCAAAVCAYGMLPPMMA